MIPLDNEKAAIILYMDSLSPELVQASAEQASALTLAMARDVLDGLGETGADIMVFFPDVIPPELVKNELPRASFYKPQQDRDQGGRRKEAFDHVFEKGYDKAILLTANVPDIRPMAVKNGLSAISRYFGQSLGPTDNGGYYLIGFSKDDYQPGVFQGVDWDSPRVFDQTMDNFTRLANAPTLLTGHPDVKTRDDILALDKRSEGTDFRDTRTFKLIGEILK